MDQNLSKLEELAAAYARSRLPDAYPAEIDAAVRRLRDRIDRGELQAEAVVGRLKQRMKPMSFGELARVVRDLDGGRLSRYERDFIADMCRRGFGFTPSNRQAAYLRDLRRRLTPRAA